MLLHCLNYSFYTGGLADHDGLEETGATMVPVGLGQSKRLLELWQELRPTAIFSTLTYPLYLAETAQDAGLDPRGLGLRRLIVAGEPGGQLDGTRRRLEELWGAELSDTYGLSDVWATFAAECEERDGLHFSGQDAVLALLAELGIGTFPTYDTGENIAALRPGEEPKRFRGDSFGLPPHVLVDVGIAQRRVESMARRVPLGAPWEAARAGRWDGETVETWLRRNASRLRVSVAATGTAGPALGWTTATLRLSR